MAKSSSGTDILTPSDYENLVLDALVLLTNEGSSFEFSVREISQKLEKGNSVNRTLFALMSLIACDLIGDSQSSGDVFDETDFSAIIDDDSDRFFLTEKGLKSYYGDTLYNEILSNFLHLEVNLHMILLSFIYAKTKSSLSFFCQIEPEKLTHDQNHALSQLKEKGLIKTFFTQNLWTVTKEGRTVITQEAQAKQFALDDYVERVNSMLLHDLFNSKSL